MEANGDSNLAGRPIPGEHWRNAMHDRRSALRQAFGAVAALCPLCSVGGARAQEAKWGYDLKDGPPAWAKLSREWRACSWGHQQTPLDLKEAIKAELHLA